MCVSYQCEEDEESGDVSKHPGKRDLQRAEHLEGWHQLGLQHQPKDLDWEGRLLNDLNFVSSGRNPVKPHPIIK